MLGSSPSPKLGELPNIFESPFNISTTAEASEFKFGMQLVFAEAYLFTSLLTYLKKPTNETLIMIIGV